MDFRRGEILITMKYNLRNLYINNRKMTLLNEEGSALVLVMFVALILSILGVAVLGATIGGAVRTETRESDVQSLHLAQKGLNEATAYIQSKLEGKTDIDPNNLEAIFKGLDEENLNVKTELGTSNSASGIINEIKYLDKNFGQQSREYYIDVTASAVVNGVNRKLKQRITLDSYPDFLKYAFGSEENLRINGAPVLYGNIYAGNKLIVTNRAEYIYKNNNLSKQTLFPKVKSIVNDAASGEVHVQSLENIEYIDSTLGSSSHQVSKNENLDVTLEKILSIHSEKVRIKEKKKFVQINVEESFFDKLADVYTTIDPRPELRKIYDPKQPIQNALNTWLVSDASVETITRPILPTKDPVSSDNTQDEIDAIEEAYKEKLKEYYLTLDTQLKDRPSSVVFDGNLVVDGVGYKGITFTTKGKEGSGASGPQWLIVAGDLTIDNYNNNYMPVKANILVTGNVTIRGKVEFNSTMIVLGKTTIEDAIIHKYEDKELVLISKGEILVNRVDAFSNKTDLNKSDEMNAFFYTDSTGELYGVGTMFWLNGGFFAKGDLTLNAVVGKVNEPAGEAYSSGFIFENQSDSLLERFRVYYNSKIFEDQKASLPRVKTISVNVGPMELVK